MGDIVAFPRLPRVDVLLARDMQGRTVWLLDWIWYDDDGENRIVISDHYDFEEAIDAALELKRTEGLQINWGGAHGK